MTKKEDFGQYEFYENYLKLVDSSLSIEDILEDNSDGILRGNILFTCLEMQNHMRSFMGSDGRYYRNELCLDTTNGETVASMDIVKLNSDDQEKTLLKQWGTILDIAKTTKNYNPDLTYGIYQIYSELDTFQEDEETKEKQYDYPELHGSLQTLKKLIRDYYNLQIVPILFEYEFLK